MAETRGAALNHLNRMEKLGLLRSLVNWFEARNLGNRPIHEYRRDAEDFANALNRAHGLAPLPVHTYNNLNAYARERLRRTDEAWPRELATEQLALPSP